MDLGHLRWLGAAAGALPLLSCHSLVEFDVTYKQCVPLDESVYVETFDEDDGFQNLTDRCWQTDNVGTTPQDLQGTLFGDDGDFVIRIADGDEWTATAQGPFAFTTLTGDFVMAARSEALNQGDGSHCLDAGNAAGLAIRDSAVTSKWTTWTAKPFLYPGADCKEADDPSKIPSAEVTATSSGSSATISEKDVGTDGEVDLAVCRVNGKLLVLYRDVSQDPDSQDWVTPNLNDPFVVGGEALHVGLTAGGASPSFQAEGHFNWVLLQHGVGSDGCAGALKRLTLPRGS